MQIFYEIFYKILMKKIVIKCKNLKIFLYFNVNRFGCQGGF